ncbi:MAG: hypothetical protein KTR16_01885 [Acidiferrobacterales bacterium]|nr:hypothetical protein [Acidiferrobacterales bacterium]
MKLTPKFFLIFLLFAIELLFSSSFAHNKVVVIPMSGDDLAPLNNVVTVAKQNGDFKNPIAAMEFITDASATNPYLVIIAPGVYDLGNDMLTLKPYVSLQGSGVNITTLKSSPNGEEATVSLTTNSSIGDMSIESDSTITSRNIFGVLATGENIIIKNCKIRATNPSFRGNGFAIVSGQESDVIIDSVEFIVENTNDVGLGSANSFSSDDSNLLIKNSVFRVASSGTAISSTGQSSYSSLIIKDSLIELLGDGGVAVTNTAGDMQLYSSLTITSLADDVLAFRGAGSGFRPVIKNSHIVLNGSNATAFQTNNGFPKIQNTYVKAQIGFKKLGSTSVFNPYYRVDSSVVEAINIVELDATGSSINIFFGATKLDGSTILNPIQGTINATCVNTYDRNYDALDATCQ